MTKEQVFKLLDGAIGYINERFCEEEYEYILDDQLENAKLPFEWQTFHGISKAVMMIKNEHYVIKFPFTHYYNGDAYCDAHWDWQEERDKILDKAQQDKAARMGDPEVELTADEEIIALIDFDNLEPDGSDECWYEPLEGASNAPISALDMAPDWDYCNLETEIYKEAVKRNLSLYFAEEGFLGTLSNGHPVYYQQRCMPLVDIDYDYASDAYEKKSKYARDTCKQNDVYCFNPLWVADFLDMYGIDEFKRLSDFIKEMRIGDLRDCNIGYLDGAPILFDYSGFRHWD